jgi:hypothetical protein
VQRLLTLAILLVTVLFSGLVAAGIAMAADGGFDVATLLEPSVSAGLLPPISIEGRSGWTCAAERSATAKTLPDAALPPVR